MAQLSEVSANPTQLAGPLRDGLETLDLGQTVTFQSYTRVVLPLDGYVFWSPSVQVVVKGSLHYAQDVSQTDEETYGAASVTFTSEVQVPQFSVSPNTTIYVATLGNFRYAFSQQQGFYSQASLWHYFGHSIKPSMATQLLDDPSFIDSAQPVVSNSLPLWLALNTYVAPYAPSYSTGITLYPSMLSPPNLVPPFGTVSIPPESTRALQAAPFLSRTGTHSQLVTDRVRVTLNGLQNNAAMDFVDSVMQYSVDTDNFGIMNMPVVTDAKRTQVELLGVGMQKVIEFEVSYYQTRVAQIARQLILSAVPTFIIGTI